MNEEEIIAELRNESFCEAGYGKRRLIMLEDAEGIVRAQMERVERCLIEKVFEGMPQGWIDDYWRSRKDCAAIIKEHFDQLKTANAGAPLKVDAVETPETEPGQGSAEAPALVRG